MSFKPVSYLQTDSRWGNVDYSASGESTTIGRAGCGPTAAAMIAAEWADNSETPLEAAKWALKNGYKAKEQGTYYSFFKPYFKQFNLVCEQLNGSSAYNVSNAAVHLAAYNAVKHGDYIIACMGKGNWTSSGHFILWYGIDGDNVLINDPASTKSSRLKASWSLFRSQVKYYFRINKPTNLVTENAENYTVTDPDGFLNVRYGAGTGYDIFGQSMKGTVIAVDKVVGSWARFVQDGVRYYACLSGLSSRKKYTTPKFKDTEGRASEKDIDDLVKFGIVKGDSSGNFRPTDNITREENAIMLRRLIRYIKGE